MDFKGKRERVKSKSKIYKLHCTFLFSLIAYWTCRTVGAGGIWCPDNLVHMLNCW